MDLRALSRGEKQELKARNGNCITVLWLSHYWQRASPFCFLICRWWKGMELYFYMTHSIVWVKMDHMQLYFTVLSI